MSYIAQLLFRLRRRGITRKKIRPTMVVELLTSFRPRARTSSDCRSSDIGKFCAEGQRLLLVLARYATVYAGYQREFWERNKESSSACRPFSYSAATCVPKSHVIGPLTQRCYSLCAQFIVHRSSCSDIYSRRLLLIRMETCAV